MSVSIEDIKKLRDMTGAGMMDAKKALEEANGDIDKAVEIMRLKASLKLARNQTEQPVME